VQARDGFVGIVWSATASQFDDLVAIEVPEFAGVTEQVQIGVLSRSANPTAALRFARYLAGRNAGQEVFARHHFDTIPDADVWEETPELTVDAGAMLEPAIAGVLTAFQQREGVRINTSYAGCGLLVTKMRNLKAGKGDGRFPDAYVSCDVSFQERVQQWFDAADAILENDIVIVVARGNPKEVRSLSDLTRSDLRIGLPHPQNSALGELIDTMLMQLGLHSAVYQPGWQDRIVHSDAAHTLVNQLRSRALDVAVVGRSNARSAPQNAEHLEVIDLDVAGALATQTFAIARDSQHKYLLRRLLAALVAPANAERAQAIGFRFIYGKGTDGQRDPGPARP
jgi:ABC-type molybdate transport system substrate-binding protein